MSSNNAGPAVTSTAQQPSLLTGTFDGAGNLLQINGPGGSAASSPYNPSSVAITGGTSQGVVAVGPYIAQNAASRLNYRKAFAKVLAGQRARMLVYGDSTTTGAGAGTNTSGTAGLVGARVKSWPSKLAAALTAAGIPAYNEAVMGDQNTFGVETYTAYDPRLVLTGGFATAGSINSPGRNPWLATATGAKFSFTPSMTFDRFDVYTAQNSGFGSVTADVDGGASLATINCAGTQNVIKTTVTCTRGTHTINLTTTSTSSVYVFGIVPWDSTLGGLDIIQAGMYAGKAADFALNASPWHPSNAAILSALAPDIAIVQLTVNDTTNGTALASYVSSIATIDSALAASGAEVLLMSGIPSNDVSSSNGTLASFVGAVSSRAAAQSHVYADLGGRCGNWASMNAAGWMFDSWHGNANFYADEGRWMAQSLLAEMQ